MKTPSLVVKRVCMMSSLRSYIAYSLHGSPAALIGNTEGSSVISITAGDSLDPNPKCSSTRRVKLWLQPEAQPLCLGSFPYERLPYMVLGTSRIKCGIIVSAVGIRCSIEPAPTAKEAQNMGRALATRFPLA